MILDVTMPGRSGLDILKDLKKLRPKVPVLFLSMHPEDQLAKRVLKAGASGYMMKESAPEELIKAIRKVLAGGLYVSATLAEKLALDLGAKAEQLHHERLSDRELEGSPNDCFRPDGFPNCRKTFFERDHRKHLSRPHPGKDEHDHKCRTHALCVFQSPCWLKQGRTFLPPSDRPLCGCCSGNVVQTTTPPQYQVLQTKPTSTDSLLTLGAVLLR